RPRHGLPAHTRRRHDRPHHPRRPHRLRPRPRTLVRKRPAQSPTNPPQAILLGVGTTAALIATTGYITVLGPAATGLSALLAASSPAVLTWLGRHLPKSRRQQA